VKQSTLFEVRETTEPSIATTPEVDALLKANAPVGIGVSGGKDSCALALALPEYLDQLGHKGPRVLIHADLGRIEWKDSLPTCERLARATGLELLVVRRKKGGMIERWKQRWTDNVTRYINLKCVQVILPWSTPKMRFCTAELKLDPICKALSARYPGQGILSVSGIRAEESDDRKNSPVSESQPRLTYKRRKTWGLTWNPLLHWLIQDVYECAAAHAFELHEAYRLYGSSRVSCVNCMLAKLADLQAAIRCADNHDVYRELVDLEIVSTFGFQGSRWLGDVAPHLLSVEQREGIALAKRKAAERVEIESRIPRHLRYTAGWPTCVPSYAEAILLAGVRAEIGGLLGLDVLYTDPADIILRYETLVAEKAAREAKKGKGKRRASRGLGRKRFRAGAFDAGGAG
jgi:3'-phosphoadenosine 5'-phosphosulfate sulfotransferase (PAPS reductase)/FAD synthetase